MQITPEAVPFQGSSDLIASNMTRAAHLSYVGLILLVVGASGRGDGHGNRHGHGQGQEQGRGSAVPNAQFYTTRVGDYNLTILSDGVSQGFPLDLLVNVHPRALEEVVRAHSLASPLGTDFNCIHLDTGDQKIVFDTGSGANLGPTLGRLLENFMAAGLDPEAVDTVVITHAHVDHIGGVVQPDMSFTFPNAKYMLSSAEFDFWTNASLEDFEDQNIPLEFRELNLMIAKNSIGAIEDNLVLFELGDEILPGITSMGLPGHSPGQSGFVIRSGNDSFMVTADAFDHDFLNIEHPEWLTNFDFDTDVGIETRYDVLNAMTDTGMRGAFYHVSFPGIGQIIRTATGFALRPARYNP